MSKNTSLNPKVSVIMPTYNRADLIGKAVGSILTQSFKDWELIIVDDGSTDDTERIINGFPAQRIRYFKKRRAGPASARNHGIKRAKGEYIAYCDDDSLYYPDHLKRLAAYLKERPKIGMVYSDGLICVPSGKPLLIAEDFDKRHLETSPFFMILNVMHRKACLGKAGVFDENLRHGEDWDMWLRISDSYPVSRLPQITAKHLCHFNIPTLNASKNKSASIGVIIKRRSRKAAEEDNLLNYINDCSMGVIRSLIAYENLNYACRLANSFYRTIKNYQTLACLGICCLAKGDYRQALDWLEKALANLPRAWEKSDPWHIKNILAIKTYLARDYYLLGNIKAAQGICREVITITPGHIDANVELTKCYIRIGFLKKAQNTLRRKFSGRIYTAAVNNLRGYCHFKSKKYIRAIREFENAVTLDPNVRVYRYNLATACLPLGKMTKAKNGLPVKNAHQKTFFKF